MQSFQPEVVFHAAAHKHVPLMEKHPCEAVLNNVYGTQALLEACCQAGVKRFVFISTDKAVNPINLYGATKLCAEKMFVQANAYAGVKDTRFSCVRYGNVVGSRGSVVPVFVEQRKRGKITLTDPRMTRFWITLDQGVRFVIRSLEQMHGGEIFVPKIPSMKLLDMAQAVAPDCEIDCIGIRPGEKLHEVLLSEDESRNTVETEDMFIIQPAHLWWKKDNWKSARRLPEGFRYTSDTNVQWLSPEHLYQMVEGSAPPPRSAGQETVCARTFEPVC